MSDLFKTITIIVAIFTALILGWVFGIITRTPVPDNTPPAETRPTLTTLGNQQYSSSGKPENYKKAAGY